MSLYTTINRYYDRIFPVNEKTITYIGSPSPSANALLDIGCATGAHCLAMASSGWRVLGIDPSPSMIETAKQKLQSLGDRPQVSARFLVGGMQDAEELVEDDQFDRILCTGNTLPHLPDIAELMSFLLTCRRKGRSEGRIVIQVLNYSKILREKPGSLPVISGDGYLFKRGYRYLPDGTIAFDTVFESNGGIAEDSTRLSPFTPATITRCAEEAGLRILARYGSWDKSAFSEAEDVQLILELGL